MTKLGKSDFCNFFELFQDNIRRTNQREENKEGNLGLVKDVHFSPVLH